jgi:MYXO-CTERM domain-containing protein
MLPFGTACASDFECASGDCDDFCTQPCTSNAQCPGFRCGASGVCEIGAPATHGEPCADPADCAVGLACVEVDGDMVCTSGCDAGCPDGTVCDRGACLPPGAVLGTPCTSSDECRSGICAATCTRLCTETSECPDAFECRPAGTLSGCFPVAVEPPPPMEGGGGKCSAGEGAGGSAAFGLSMLGVAAVLVSRRRRR